METPAFIQNIGWGTFGFGGFGFANRPALSNAVYNGPLAGLSHYSLHDVYHHIQVGTQLELEREPRNRHDYNAIAVYFRNHKIGYLPKSTNELAAFLMDEQTPIHATVTRVIKTKYMPTTGLEVEVLYTVSREAA